ncbi:MAG TPA: hypothetical protein VKT52_03945 [Ktedonobacterales bacterium]|nr:hypothetical protein [Ktedonobacterales bacterium]
METQPVQLSSTEEERRRRFLEGANEEFACLRADPAAWAQEIAERQEWDTTLLDGLTDEKPTSIP